MEVLVLDGKNYVKASKAAKDLGYATDYVGQLCRSGQVDAHLIGRTWYVNQEQLGSHRVEKKRISRVKAREQAKKAIEEHRLKVTETTNTYKNIDIQYQDDDRELIPTTKISEPKKLEIRSESAQAKAIAEAEFEEKGGNIIDNEGDKVLMSGDLTVVDVTDGPSDDDTITLTPRMMRRKPDIQDTKEEPSEKSVLVSGEGGESTVIQIQKEEHKIPTFTERLDMEVKEEIKTESVDSKAIPIEFVGVENTRELTTSVLPVVPPTIKKVPKSSVLPYYIILFFVLIGVTASFPLTVKFKYEDSNKDQIATTYNYQYREIFQIIHLKIKESRLNKI